MDLEMGTVTPLPPSRSGSHSQASDAGWDAAPTLSADALAFIEAIKKESGFDSYFDYLHFHQGQNPHLQELSTALEEITRRKVKYGFRYTGSIIHVFEGGRLSLSHFITRYAAMMIQGLDYLPPDAQAHIVLWNVGERNGLFMYQLDLDEELLNVFGLHFQLDPRFFEDLLQIQNSSDARNVETPAPHGRYEPTHCRLNTAVATLRHSKHQDSRKPIVLIAGFLDQDFHGRFVGDKGYITGSEFLPLIGQCPPFSRAPSSEIHHKIHQCNGPYRYYPRLLISWLQQYADETRNPENLALLCFLFLSQLEVLAMRYLCDSIRTDFYKSLGYSGLARPKEEDDSDDKLPFHRYFLRQQLSDAEDHWCNFKEYIMGELRTTSVDSPMFQRMENRFNISLAEGYRLESQIRDHLQLRVGELSLQESRKSIEVSKIQIAEAQRGKNAIFEEVIGR